jgi:hypothetical protein
MLRTKEMRQQAGARGAVGSYGTHNIVVIGMMVLERPTECLVLMFCLSSNFRGIPFS